MDVDEAEPRKSGRMKMPNVRQLDITDSFPSRKQAPAPTAKAPSAKLPRASSSAAAKAKATRTGSGRAGSGRAPRGPQQLSEYPWNGDTLRVGDCVYTINTEDEDVWPADEDEEDKCEVCRKGHSSRKANSLLECGRCLSGYHMQCLKPKLKACPEDEWLCADCEQGRPPARKSRNYTAATAFLFGKTGSDAVLSLARISSIVRGRQGDDSQVEFGAHYFCLPEETAQGRDLRMHHTREVFLTPESHFEDVTSVFRTAQVVRRTQLDDTPGNDVFVCEFAYDKQWKRYRRVEDEEEEQAAKQMDGVGRGQDARDSDDGEEWCPARHGDDSQEGDGFSRKVSKGHAGRGRMLSAGRMAVSTRNMGANRYRNGAEDIPAAQLGHLGQLAVPDRPPPGPLSVARTALSLAAAPSVLPCRDVEKAHLTEFVGKAIGCAASASPGVLYICGVPGTGKTACVMEVLGTHKAKAQAQGVQVVMLNALQLTSPLHVYTKLWEQLVGQRLGPARALAQLQTAFGANGGLAATRRQTTIILIDEIDMLMTRDQAILYNLFDWPMIPGSRLSVIGISNTHDLDERVLPRIASRLANQKLAFQPYNKNQLMTIIHDRLKGCDVFNDSALEFAAMKAASTTGDVRRALELLRRAADLANIAVQEAVGRGDAPPATFKQLVTHSHVMEAQKEQFNSAHMEMLRGCCLLEKLVLAGLLVAMRAAGKPTVPLMDVHHRLCSTFAPALPESRCMSAELMHAAAGLVGKHLVVSEPAWKHLQAKVSLNVPKDDVLAMFKEDERMLPLASLLH